MSKKEVFKIKQDKSSVLNVLGSIIKEPTLLSETERYRLEKQDFPEKFHNIVFSAIYNLFNNGAESIDEFEIDGFLKDYPVQHHTFKINDGLEYIRSAIELSHVDNFEFHYNRVKKLSLVREMRGLGFDISEIYNDELFSPQEDEAMRKRFDNASIDDIIQVYESKMIDVRDKFQSDGDAVSAHAGDGIMELIESLKNEPDIGLPLHSDMLTDVARGARPKKFYLRSSTSGGGKTRGMIADGCRIAVLEYYDFNTKKWEKNDFTESVTVISTEMLVEELQQIALSYVSGVEEHKLVTNTMTQDEAARIYKAGLVIKESAIHFEELPNFDTVDIERVIEKNIIRHDTSHVWFDYLHTSMSIMSELSTGVSMREDQILLLMATRLKVIANKHDVFLMSATQLSSNWEESWRKGEEINANHLQNSKSVVNKADFASIMLPPSKKELDEIEPILAELDMGNGKGFGNTLPNHVTHVFKNRGNPYNKVKIFSYLNLGNMRNIDMFITDYENKPVSVPSLKIKVK